MLSTKNASWYIVRTLQTKGKDTDETFFKWICQKISQNDMFRILFNVRWGTDVMKYITDEDLQKCMS